MQFTKMQGAGNDYIYINCFQEKLPRDLAKLSIAMSDRHFGIGGDGMVLICPSERADAKMRMFNADGTEAEMCGNAVRCVVKYLYDHDIVRKPVIALETGRGILTLELNVQGQRVHSARVNMGEPILKSNEIPTTLPGDPPRNVNLTVEGKDFEVTCVSAGNPHCVIFVDEITDEHVLTLGPKIEHHEAFPNRVNVEFIQVQSETEATMRVWERGSGETWACGTGACAAHVAGVLTGRYGRKITMHLRGGDLELEWNENDNCMYKTGPAVEVFTGDWPLDV